MLLASGASIPTIAGTVEEEEEYARSEANSAHYDGYVTDHTDLASEIDIDESEYRRELLNDKWRMLFDKFDPEGFGEIPVEDFLAALKSAEWKTEIPPNKRDILLTRAKESRVEAVTFQDFVNVKVNLTQVNRRTTSIRVAYEFLIVILTKNCKKKHLKVASTRNPLQSRWFRCCW
ncbi:rhomboid-related protein 3-like isoform X2 [Apis florea]|uniref:rhomboid-related protein 3-like isoform X2 n=1 Tax=Apis florea TaxID=7463 RepID=UPI000252C6E6|nr:rhomboid-related protein 3-like isoform X2 [Apis florea]